MPLLSWQKWWIRTPSRRPAAPKARFRKFFLESLEERVLLSNTYTVNLAGDAGVGTGLTGDIRYCITQANLPANIGSTIKFATIPNGVITLSTNELEISQDMTITGPGASKLTIDGGTVAVNGAGQVSNGVRVFNITSQNAHVTISGLTINNGDANPANNLKFAGNQGGNIFNSGTLTLTNDIVSNGVSFGIIGAPPGRGGGIFNARNATLILDNTIVTANQAIGQPGQGGGIFSDTGATLNIIHGSSVTNNLAIGDFGADGAHGFTPTKGPGGAGGSGVSVAGGGGWGGGIYSTGGSLSITGDSKTPIVISGNQALGARGGNGGIGGNAAGAPTGAFTGFHGGRGGTAGAGSDGLGGGLYVATGAASFNFVQLTNNTAQGGDGGQGGNGGNAGAGGGSGPGGIGGAAGGAGAAGNARGGGLYTVTGTAFQIQNTQFSNNQAIGGNGGIAGNGGPGGDGGGPGHGGTGGLAGLSAIGGDSQGGGIYNGGGALTLDSTQFTSNQATSGTGGSGGNGGAGGASGSTTPRGTTEIGGAGARGADGSRAGMAWGGAVYNQGGDLIVGSTAPVTFTTNVVTTATGGSGGIGGAAGNGRFLGGQGGDGGNGSASTFAYGGAIAVTVGNLGIANSTFSASGGGNRVVGGAGGAGGLAGAAGNGDNGTPPTPGSGGNGGVGGTGGGGSYAYGGSISLSVGAGNLAIKGTTISGSSVASGAGGIGGVGGVGGTGGDKFGFGGNGGNGGFGGTAGAAGGGAVSYFVQSGGAGTSDTVTLANNTISNNQVIGGAGGAGQVGGAKGIPGSNLRGSPFVPPYGVAGFSGSGGSAQDAAGGGFYIADNREAANVSFSNNSISGNSVQGGTGGLGANGAGSLPRLPGSGFGVTTGAGGSGGLGGTAEGGGVAFVNNSGAIQVLNFSGDSLANNKVTGGTGGGGGNAGSSGSISIAGGTGGPGGQGSGAGVYTLASALSVNNVSLSGVTLSGNVVTGGTGGQGGAGFEAPGGTGGLGAGGAVYSTSLNANKFSILTLNGNTLLSNQAVGGVGGAAGSGTTPNGGQGGQGGHGGDGQGGALFGGDDTHFNIYNNAIGAVSGTTTFGNSVLGGLGGRGGNAGTPAAKPSNNGGSGGNGGSGFGGAVFIHSGTANFLNDTIIENQAVLGGLGGAPGGGAGLTGKAGNPGSAGTGFAGGYFAFGAAGSAGNPTSNNIGNSIIDLNAAGANPDVQGTFNSLGHNLLGSTVGATGFVSSDQTGIAQTQLNLGPLQNNGGTASSNALLTGSVAIDAGDATLLPTGNANAPEGTQVAWIQNAGTISQAVNFAAGTYTLSFVAAQRANFPSNTSLQVQIDGVTVATITPADTNYKTYTTPSFTVTNGNHTIQFVASGAAGSTAFLDQVSILAGGVPAGTQPGDAGFETPSVGTGFAVAPNSAWRFTGASGIAGNGSILTSGDNTDQRGTGFVRVAGANADVGAFEFQLPTITGYSPASGTVLRGSPGFDLTILGTGFMPGATVSFGGLVLTPTATGPGSLTVSIPATSIAQGGPVTVIVTVPDGSGVAGSTLTGPASTYVIATPTTVVVNNPGNQTSHEGDAVDLTVTSTDAFATNWTATGLPPGLSIADPTTGEITGTIAPYAAGVYTVTVSASDVGVTGSTTFTWTVIASTPPTLNSPGNPIVAAGSSVQLAITALHADPGTFSATGLPPGLSINPNTGLITGTIPGSAGGDYNVTVSASRDGIPGSVSFVFTVTGGSGGVAGLGFFTLGFGTLFPLPSPGQSAGVFGLALEEFALTISPMLANILAFLGQPNQQVKDQIPGLLNAINHDPLHGTPLGTMAEFLGYQAAINVLSNF